MNRTRVQPAQLSGEPLIYPSSLYWGSDPGPGVMSQSQNKTQPLWLTPWLYSMAE